MKQLLILSLLLILAFFFYKYARSIWHPAYLKIKGKKTSQEVVTYLNKKGIGFTPEEIKEIEKLTLIALKDEQILEVWAHYKNKNKQKIKQYKFAGFSGKLGPKLKEGDKQIPEGLYKIEYLNPNSSYHLSMKIDYPNAFDKQKAKEDKREKLGFDIFIHGKTFTVGCIPIGDKNIEELFVFVAQIGRTNIDVIITPYDMRSKNKNIELSHISWENDLYKQINNKLKNFK